MGVNANKTTYELARQGFSHPLRQHNPMPGTPVKFVRGWGSGTGEGGNMNNIGSPYMDKDKLRAFSKNPPKQAGELLNLTINQ